VVILSQAISMMGKTNLPVLPFAGAGMVVDVVNRAVPLGFPAHLTRLLQFGRVVDTAALRERFGLALRYSTPDTVLEHVRGRRARDLVAVRPGHTYEAELEEFLQAQSPASANGHRKTARARPATRPVRRTVRRSPDHRA